MNAIVSMAVALAVFFSATIPAGWMPKTLSPGQIVLVICTGHAFSEVIVDEHGVLVPEHEQTGDTRTPCAFAALPDVSPVMDGPFALPLSSTLTARWDHHDFTHNSAGYHRSYDARGPPAFS